MGRQDNSYRPLSARTPAPGVNPEQPGNWKDSVFKARCVTVPDLEQSYQDYEFDIDLAMEMVLFTSDYPVITRAISDYSPSDQAGWRSFQEALFFGDGDIGDFNLGAASQLLKNTNKPVGRQQEVIGETFTASQDTHGYYLAGFFQDRALDIAGTPVNPSVVIEAHCDGPQSEGPQHWFGVGDGANLQNHLCVLLYEPQYTEAIRLNGNLLVTPNAFWGFDYLHIVGLFCQHVFA